MRERTVGLRASTLGDGFGICRFVHDLDGLHGIGHGGSGNGQCAELLLVPEPNVADAPGPPGRRDRPPSLRR